MSLPDDLPPGEPEKVDNTNAIHRRFVAELMAVSTVDAAATVEAMIGEGALSATDVETVVEKGWISRKRADDAVEAFDDALPVEPVEDIRPVQPVDDLIDKG